MAGGGSIDAFRLARKQAEVAGTLDLRTASRIADRLAGDAPASVRWRIAGVADGAGRPALEVTLDGTVPLQCQRCLRTFGWPVSQRTQLLLAHDESELARLDDEDDREVVLGSEPLAVQDLIEEEVLLTLPFVPRCDAPDCRPAGEAAAGEVPVRSPFDALEVLRAEAGGPERKGRS